MSGNTYIKTILLAEDDNDDRELFSEAMARINAETVVQYAENGNDALRKLEAMSVKPDMIFLDINMPVMNGWQCLKALKADERFKDIPVIVYSSSSHDREKNIAIELGALLFFTKPNDFYHFKERLEVIVTHGGNGSLDGHPLFN